MRPLWFLQLRAASDGTVAAPVVRTQMLLRLHPIFREQPGRFAIALPPSPGSLRVFSHDRNALTDLASSLGTLPWWRDYTAHEPVTAVSVDFAGPWVSYRRFRIPTLRSDRHVGSQHGQLRARRLASATSRRLDYFVVQSRSTGQRFALTVERFPEVSGECVFAPNSYGLSSSASPLALPDLP